MHYAELINGSMLLIDSFAIETFNHQLILSLVARIGSITHHIVFHNVSALHIQDFSYPMQIPGIAVKDRLQEGWQKDVRYEVYDFEDGVLRFFCEKIDILD